MGFPRRAISAFTFAFYLLPLSGVDAAVKKEMVKNLQHPSKPDLQET